MRHESFINFCETKPPEEIYNYSNTQECAIGQYYRKTGKGWYDGNEAELEDYAAERPHTFGALVKRLNRR